MIYPELKEKLDKIMADFGYVTTYTDESFTRFDHITHDVYNQGLLIDVIMIDSNSVTNNYENYSFIRFRSVESTHDKMPMPISRDLLKSLDQTVKELQKYYN